MKKVFIVVLVMGLSVVSLAGAEAKKKKAPKAVPLSFYLHFPSDGGNCGTSYMDLDRDTVDSGCGYIAQPANEIFHATGVQETLKGDWPATKGVPFKLDARKPVTAQFALLNVFGLPASGQAVMDLKISGTIKGSTVTLVEESLTLDMAGPGSHVAEFEAALAKNLSGKKVTSLVATTLVRGPNNFHFFDLDREPMAHIVIPTLK